MRPERILIALARLVDEHRAQHPRLKQHVRFFGLVGGKQGQITVRVVEHAGRPFTRCVGKPERWVLQTDFSNDEAVSYLADRLAGAGGRRTDEGGSLLAIPSLLEPFTTASFSIGSLPPVTGLSCLDSEFDLRLDRNSAARPVGVTER